MINQKLSLGLPMFSFRCWYSSFSFLEERPWKVSRSSRELHPFKGTLDQVITVDDYHWCSSNKQRKYVSIFHGQFWEWFAKVSHIHTQQGSKQWDVCWSRRKFFGSEIFDFKIWLASLLWHSLVHQAYLKEALNREIPAMITKAPTIWGHMIEEVTLLWNVKNIGWQRCHFPNCDHGSGLRLYIHLGIPCFLLRPLTGSYRSE